MSEFKIRRVVSGNNVQYFVHKALGPWPFKNWSWRAVHVAETRAGAEQWVADTLFTESPAGIAAEQARLAKAEEARAQRAALITKMSAQGWYWSAQEMTFFNLQNSRRVTLEMAEDMA